MGPRAYLDACLGGIVCIRRLLSCNAALNQCQARNQQDQAVACPHVAAAVLVFLSLRIDGR